MRIAMIGSRGIPHTYGGGEEFVRHLAPRMVQRGHEVIVYCRSNYFKDRTPYYQGVRRIFLPTIEHKVFGQFIHAALSMVDVLFRNVDVIYVHTLPNSVHTIIPWLFRKKVVVNTDGLDWKRTKWGRLIRSYFKLSAWLVVHTATELVSDSRAIRDYYLSHFGRDSTFIAYGAEVGPSEYPEVLQQYGLEPMGYYLIACRLVPENNIDLIVKAFEQVETDRLLVIAGGANYKSPWAQRLKSTQDPRIRFLGHVSNPDHVKELHCHCYAYLHGHSLGGTNPALLKALGYGNCVLALNTPFNREVLQGDSGVMYGLTFEKDVEDLRDKIQYIDAHPEVAAEYRTRAPERIREAYTWDRIADEYEALFKRLVYGEGSVKVSTVPAGRSVDDSVSGS